MNVRCTFSGVALLVILVLSFCICNVNVLGAQTDDTASKLQTANGAVEQAFNGVLSAESAGANVTDFLIQLNSAANLIDQAQNAYKTGDNNTANTDATDVILIAQEVTTAAQTAKESATVNSQNTFWRMLTYVTIGSFVFIFLMLLVWHWFKRRYISNLSQGKPEVTTNAV